MKKKSIFKLISLILFSGLIFCFYYIFSLITATPISLQNKTGVTICVHSASLGDDIRMENTPIKNWSTATFTGTLGSSKNLSIKYSRSDSVCEVSGNLIKADCRLSFENADVCYISISRGQVLSCSECYQ